MTYAICVFVLIAGLANGTMDGLQFRYQRLSSIFPNAQFWNPKISWRNKGDDFLRRTILVFTTDGWHLAQFVFLNSMFIALILSAYLSPDLLKDWYTPILAYAILRTIFAVGFYAMYEWVPFFTKQKNNNEGNIFPNDQPKP